MDLLRRLSRNPETAPVLASANNFRRFSQNAMTSTGIRSVEESVDSFDQPSRRKTEIGQVPPEIGPRSSVTGGPRRSQLGSGPRQSLRSKDNLFMKGSSMEIVASIESNGKSLHRARKQSVKRQSVTVGDKVRSSILARHKILILTPIWGILGTSGSVISGQKIQSYFFGFDDVIPDRKFFVS